MPSKTAMVAGVAPPSRTSNSTLRAVSRFAGKGMPWLMMVLSSATAGRPADSAAATARERCMRSGAAASVRASDEETVCAAKLARRR